MDIHLVRVPQHVDVVNVRVKPVKWGEHPASFSVHVDIYGCACHFSVCQAISFLDCDVLSLRRVLSHSPYLPHFCGVSFSSFYHHCTLATGHTNASTMMYLQCMQSNICTERNVCTQHRPVWVCVEQWNYPPFSSRRLSCVRGCPYFSILIIVDSFWPSLSHWYTLVFQLLLRLCVQFEDVMLFLAEFLCVQK